MRGIQLTTKQLLLITALFALVVGAVTAANRESYDAGYYHLTYSSNGRYLIGCYSNRSYRSRIRESEIHVWDLSQTPPLKKRIMATGDQGTHWNTFYGQQLLYTVDASTIALATTSIDNVDSPGQLILWDFIRDEYVKTIPLPTSIPRYRHVSVATDAMLAAAIDDNDQSQVVILNMQTGDEVTTIATPDKNWSIGLSFDGHTLLTAERPSGTTQTIVRIWDVAGGSEIRQIAVEGSAYGISFGDKQFCVSTYGQLETYDLESGEKTKLLKDIEILPNRASMPANGSRYALASKSRTDDDRISVIDVTTCRRVGTISQGNWLECHAETADSGQLAIAFDNELVLFDSTTLKRTEILWKESDYGIAICISFMIGFLLWGIIWRITSPDRQTALKRRSPPQCLTETATFDRIAGAILVVLLASVFTFALCYGLENWDLMFFAWPLFAAIIIAAAWFDRMYRVFRRRTSRNAWKSTLDAINNAQNVKLQTTRAGDVTAAFFPGSKLESEFDWEWNDVQRSFKRLAGRSTVLRDSLLILVFQQQDELEYQLGGELAAGEMYNTIEPRAQRIVISEEGVLARLKLPKRSLRFWLGTYICEQALKKKIPPFLAYSVSARLGNHGDQHAVHTSLRRLQVSRSENSGSLSKEIVQTAIHTSWKSYWVRAQKGKLGFDISNKTRALTPVEAFRESVRLKDIWIVFAAFLVDETGTNQPRFDPLFQKLMDEEKRRRPVNQMVKFELHELVDEFLLWFNVQSPSLPGESPEHITTQLNRKLVRSLVDNSVPNYERIEIVRSLGLSGYAATVDPLRRMLSSLDSKSDSSDLTDIEREEVHDLQTELRWALGNLMGEAYSSSSHVDEKTSKHQPTSEDEAADIIHAAEIPLSADDRLYKKGDIPKQLKRCLMWLFMAGVITIVWSTFVLFTNDEQLIVWLQAVAIMIGCSAVAVSGSRTEGAIGAVTALLVISMFFTCNLPVFILAIFATPELAHIDAQRYFKARAGLKTASASDGLTDD